MAGRKTDIAIRGRTACFAEALSGITGLTDDQLDQRYLPEKDGERTKTFWKLRNLGPNLESKKAIQIRGFNLIEAIEEDPKYSYATDVYKSCLWDMVGPVALSNQQIKSLIQNVLSAHNLYRASFEETLIGNSIAKDKRPFDWNDESYSIDCLYELASTGNFHILGLICALFSEALHKVALNYADALIGIFYACLSRAAFKYRFSKRVEIFIRFITSKRLFKNTRDLQITNELRDLARESINNERLRKNLRPLKLNEDSFWIDAEAMRHGNSTLEFMCPIVEHTEETRRIQNNREELKKELNISISI